MEINVKRMLRDLSNPDDDLRALSAMTLMKVDVADRKAREDVIAALMKATKDKNIAVRFFSRKAIDKLRRANLDEDGAAGAARVAPDKALQSEAYEERLTGIMQIARENKAEFKDQLVAMLQTEKHDFVKASLISCLKNFLTKDEAALLTPFLTDPDNRVRSNTIEALERLKADKSIPLLFPSLEDPDNRIRAVAAKALSSFGEEKVFATLKKMLHSAEEWMKTSAIHSLSHIQAGEAISLLIEAARNQAQVETSIKATIALANYHDLTAYGFLKHLSGTGEEPFKGTAGRAIKLLEEKFGVQPPTSTMVTLPAENEPKPTPKKGAKDASPTDLAGTVSRFFRKGTEAAVDMSQKAAISFVVNDLRKEQTELLKEMGRVVFELYQQGELTDPELLTMGHEILRMNFFIQKYTETEDSQTEAKKGGFFTQLRNLFAKPAEEPKSSKASQAEKFTQKREDLFQKLGEKTYRKVQNKDFAHSALEGYCQSYNDIEHKLNRETTPP